MEVRRENLLGRAFEPGFRLDLHHKDLGIALAAAAEHGLDLPATPVVRAQMERLPEQGRGDQDHTALLDAIDRPSGSPGQAWWMSSATGSRGAAKGVRRVPRLPISISTTSPARMNCGGWAPAPTPAAVPVAITSPASRLSTRA